MSLARCFLFVSVLSCITAFYDIDDSLLYKIDFPGLPTPKNDPDINTEELESVFITSTEQEKFECLIPKASQLKKFDEEKYSGKTVLQLIEGIFVQQSCAYRIEAYWTYELCHGKHIRQYHEERDGKVIKMLEYNLGTFSKEMLEELVSKHKKDVANGITRHPPTKKIEGVAMPYYEVTMTEGTKCDLTQLPRKSRVLYICYPKGKNEIYSFKEMATCEYEIVVLSSSLCSHPSYKPPESKENFVSCSPVTEGQPLKPVKLAKLELDSLKLRTENMLEAHVSQGNLPGQVKVEIKPVNIDGEVDLDAMDDLQDTVDRIKESQWKATDRQPFKPLMDPEVVKQFLKGEYCLFGGSGWWKYEFCYGKKVDQYHDEGKGRKTVINLGHFSLEDHTSWLESRPAKKPKEGSLRKQVSVFYSGGDVCDLTGQPRQVEVKMKCKPAESPSTVSLYLLEPKVCEYVLGVESPLVCDLLPHAHPTTGLFPTELIDSLGEKTEDKVRVEAPHRITKKTTYKTNEVVKNGQKSSTAVEETVEVVNGGKKIIRKTIVDDVVVSEEKIFEKDGVVVDHSEITSEDVEETESTIDKDEL